MSSVELQYCLAWLSLRGFRSYESVEWKPSTGVNVLVGKNGAGKTNLLEAIAYLATLRSFRRAPDAALIAHGQEAAILRGEVSGGEQESLIEIEIPVIGTRRSLINRQRLAKIADLLGHCRVVTFLPEDLDIVKRGPANRRDFLDDLAVQLWPGSYPDQLEFDRAVRQRNAFLKRGERDPSTLAVWDERVASAGGRVMSRRARAGAALAKHLSEAYARVAGSGTIGLEYVSGWGGEMDPSIPASEHAQLLTEALRKTQRADFERRVTSLGPHRDEPVLTLDGHDMRYHGSQGEQRTVSLALRLGAHSAITETISMQPILLLDDVFSELDPERSAALGEALPKSQVMVTTTHLGDVPVSGSVWDVEDGGIRC